MDASNPVLVQGKVKIGTIREKAQKRFRQNLGMIKAMARGKSRLALPTLDQVEDLEENLAVVVDGVKDRRKFYADKISKGMETPLSTLLETKNESLIRYEPVPVSGLMYDGAPIHPPGKNQKQGWAATTLSFGGIGIDIDTVTMLAEFLPASEVNQILTETPCYTKGTPLGFFKRIQEQMGRECVQIGTSYKNFVEMMDRALPVSDLVDWHADVMELVEQSKTNMESSAGAPYWRKKKECVEEMFSCVLPKIIDAYTHEGGAAKLFKEEPELFLCSIKNKDDRYADPEDKTRPYVSLPWHFQAPISAILQTFCDSLKLFHEKPKCRNAYGFSYANGGADKLAKWLLSTKKYKFCCYGDDSDVAVNINGRIYRICPDFRQMDGSVDETTIKFTIDWIYDKFKEQFGDNQFYRNLFDQWAIFALHPMFLIEGSGVWSKKRADGLMTGVVGTTLFDTVKSIYAYERFGQFIERNPQVIFDEQKCVNFFKTHGLEIKQGTWNPTCICDVSPGGYLSAQKFLGMQLLKIEFCENEFYVPTIPYNDWVNLLITPKNIQDYKATLAKQRYMFDRLRGYLTTGGAFSERFRLLCNSLLEFIPNEALLMAVADGDGRGAPPELVKNIGEDFEYPNSSGWPTPEWVANLYAPESMKHPEYEDLERIIEMDENSISKYKERKPIPTKGLIVDIKKHSGYGSQVVGSFLNEVREEPELVAPPLQNLTYADKVKPVIPGPNMEYNPKSKIVDFNPRTGEETEMKYLPTAREIIVNQMASAEYIAKGSLYDILLHLSQAEAKFGTEKAKSFVRFSMQYYSMDVFQQMVYSAYLDGMDLEEIEAWEVDVSQMVSVSELVMSSHLDFSTVKREARELGYFIIGPRSNEYICSAPIQTPQPYIRRQIAQQEEENVEKLKEVKEKIKTTPISKATTGLLQQKQVLTKVVERSEEIPAHIPEPPISDDFPIRFKEVPGLDPMMALKGKSNTFRVALGYVRRILQNIGLRFDANIERNAPPDASNGKAIFTVDGYIIMTGEGRIKALYRKFYNVIIDEYIRQIGKPLLEKKAEEKVYVEKFASHQPPPTWSDLTDVSNSVTVRLYKDLDRPLFIQPVGGDIIPLEKIRGFHSVNGVTFFGTQPIVYKNKTSHEVAQRLSKMLQVEVYGDKTNLSNILLDYPELKNHPAIIAAQRNAERSLEKIIKNNNKTKQQQTSVANIHYKDAQEDEEEYDPRGQSRNRSPQATTSWRGPRESSSQRNYESPQRKYSPRRQTSTKVQYGYGPKKSDPGERFRFSRVNNMQNRGQGGAGKISY